MAFNLRSSRIPVAGSFAPDLRTNASLKDQGEIDGFKMSFTNLDQEMGLVTEKIISDRKIKALKNPEQFFKDKMAAKQTIVDVSREIFTKLKEQYTKAGVPDAEAANYALTKAKEKYKILSTDIDELYPEDFMVPGLREAAKKGVEIQP